MVFDGLGYAESLAHLGRPLSVEGLPFAVLRRPIRGTNYHDVLSTWPYGSAPDIAGLPVAADELRRSGAVSLTAVVTPAAALDPAAVAAVGMSVAPLKTHYIIDRACGQPMLSAKARRNVRIASRFWTVDPAPDRFEIVRVARAFYAALQKRRQMSSEVTRMPPEHFKALLDVPGITAVAARNGERIGALIVAARDAAETHLLHFLADAGAAATCPTYLLMAYVSEAWTGHGPVYLGGAPSGPDGPGVAKFKARWANRSAPAWLLTAILRKDVYARLTRRGAARSSFFPAYRRPIPTVPAAASQVDRADA